MQPELRSRRRLRTNVIPSLGEGAGGWGTTATRRRATPRRAQPELLNRRSRSAAHDRFHARAGRLSRPDAGFALPSAIFLLVILASLGAFLASIATWQHKGTADDVQGTRALLAARAGVDWELYRVIQATSCVGGSFVPPGTALADFTVTVTCTATTATEAGTAVTVYLVTATACNQPSGGNCPNTVNPGAYYVERQWAAAVSQ